MNITNMQVRSFHQIFQRNVSRHCALYRVNDTSAAVILHKNTLTVKNKLWI